MNLQHYSAISTEVKGAGYLVRASRQNKVQGTIAASLLLAACSTLGALSLSTSTSALLDLKPPLLTESEKPSLIKRITSQVPVVSSLLDSRDKAQSASTQGASSNSQGSANSSRAANASGPQGSSESSTNNMKRSVASVPAPVIKTQEASMSTLQFVGLPIHAGDGRLIAAPVAQTTSTFAVLEPSIEGWRIFGMAWYWWLGTTALATGAFVWRSQILRFVIYSRTQWQVLLGSKQ